MDIVGHSKKITILKELLEKQTIFPAFLFWGPEQVGKFTLAKEFARGVACQNSKLGGCQKCPVCTEGQKTKQNRDLIFLTRQDLLAYKTAPNNEEEDNPYGINGIRRLINFSFQTPVLGKNKAIVIDDAHLLTLPAQNKLLKTLEEPAPHTVFILVTHKPEELLATLRSRTLSIYFGLASQEEMKIWVAKKSQNRRHLKEILRYSLGRPGRATVFLENPQAVLNFNKMVLALLELEDKNLAKRLIFAGRLSKRAELNQEEMWQIWQVVLRDELLLEAGLTELTQLLTKPRPKFKLTARTKAIKELLRLEQLVQGALSPKASQNSLEYMSFLLE